MTPGSVPLLILGVFGVRIAPGQAQFLLSSLCQASGAIVALVLTANILFTQLQTYALPVRFLVVWDRGTKATYFLLAASTALPALLILFGWYAPSDVAVALLVVSLVVLGFYVRSRPKSVSLDRFFNEMVTYTHLREESAAELYHMCLVALDKRDIDTFRKACLLLFSIDQPSDALYEFWNNVVERVQDEPQAVTPLAEAVYVCGSPLAVTYVIDAAARPRHGGGVVNPLFSGAMADQAPHYLTRLLLLSAASGPAGRALVRQEVVENLVLLLLDLLTECELAAAGGGARVSGATLPTLVGYLDEAEDEVLMRIMRGDAIYHFLMFALPGAERFAPAQRASLGAARRSAWDRIVGHVFYHHGWDSRPKLELALWRDGGEEPQVVRGPDAIRELIGERGADGLTCEWHPPRRGTGFRAWLPRR